MTYLLAFLFFALFTTTGRVIILSILKTLLEVFATMGIFIAAVIFFFSRDK